MEWTRRTSALLVSAAGALHLYLWFDYFHRVHVVGALFLANAAAGLALGAALLVAGSPLVLGAGAAFVAGTLAAFAISTRWALFGYHESLWGSWQEAAGGVELAALVLLAVQAYAQAGSSASGSPDAA
jgi:hypothetical protein